MVDIEPVYSLQEAVTKVLRGRWTVASLRTEIRKGRLRPTRIAGKLGVTDSALGEMLKLCQDAPKVQGSTSERAPAASPSGLSETDQTKLALDAARATAKALKRGSVNISRKNTRHQKQTVVFIEPGSRTS